jgi:hypothetical protein
MLQVELARAKEQINNTRTTASSSSQDKKAMPTTSNWSSILGGGVSGATNNGQLSPPTSQKSGVFAVTPCGSLLTTTQAANPNQLRKFGVPASGRSGMENNGSLSQQQHHLLSGE